MGEWYFKSREELIDYAMEHHIPVTATKAKPYSTDRNLFHISYEGAYLKTHGQRRTADMYTMSLPVERRLTSRHTLK